MKRIRFFLILDELFTIEGYEYIEKLSLVKNLLDLGVDRAELFCTDQSG